jgi:voltage-gated potassium channel Kch
MAEGLGQERFSLRRSFQSVPDGVRWAVLAVVAATAFVLGFAGFVQLNGWGSAGDNLYGTIKLFFLSAPENGSLPVSLEIARFLAPLASSYAAVRALAILFQDRLQLIRIMFMRDHVVMCGLGFIGSAFLRQLSSIRARVVVVEPNGSNPMIEVCRRERIPVVVGDALVARTLVSARITRARHLLAVTNDDAVNTEIVVEGLQLVTKAGRGPLRCLARVGDPELCALLRIQESSLDYDSLPALDFFNLPEIAARLMVEEHPFDTARPDPHILVGDLDKLGSWLVLHASRTWFDRRAENAGALRISVLDPRGEQRLDDLVERHPEVAKVCSFVVFGQSTRELARLREALLDPATPRLGTAYLGSYEDEQALELALTLRLHLPADVPLVLALSRGDGIGRVLRSRDAQHSELANIEVFPYLDRACTRDFLEGGSFEMIARAIHTSWMAQRRATGRAVTRWEELDESRRNSSRDQARGIASKLHSIGCDIGPLSDWDAAEFEFRDEELENLAEQEHARWNAERERDGWVLDESLTESDADRKRTPYLLPFDELVRRYPDIAEYDRQFVREIPARLAEAGLQVVRPPNP